MQGPGGHRLHASQKGQVVRCARVSQGGPMGKASDTYLLRITTSPLVAYSY